MCSSDLFPSMIRFSIDSVILGFASWAFYFFPLGLSGFLPLWEEGNSLSRAYKSATGVVQSLSTQRIRDGFLTTRGRVWRLAYILTYMSILFRK